MTEFFFQSYLFLATGLSVIYALIIATYRKGWKMLPEFTPSKTHTLTTKVSVIIPARNEERNIKECLLSVLNQNINPALFELIVIDDHSDDNTVSIIKKLQSSQIKLIHLADFVEEGETTSFKKKAIDIAIKQASGDLIVCTDADCVVPDNWLQLMVSFYEIKKVKFIAAPVLFHREKNHLQYFQTLDFFGMMCVTGAGIQTRFMHMCNGANLAYEKAAFLEVNGFEGIDHLASGDDMLLMQKIAAKYPRKIGFLKNVQATVQTEAKETFASFISQRIRWATKSSSYQEWQVTAVLAMVFFFCCSIVFNFFLIPFYGKIAVQLFLFQLLIKSIVDYFYLNKMAVWFEKREAMRYFISSQLMHVLYIAFIGFAANIWKEYDWKGRKVK